MGLSFYDVVQSRAWLFCLKILHKYIMADLTFRLTLIRQLGIKLIKTAGANAVGKLGLGVITDILFDLTPVSLVIPIFFTGSADGQKPAQNLHLGQSLMQLFGSFPHQDFQVVPMLLHFKVNFAGGKEP
jgi:hypothetical protein